MQYNTISLVLSIRYIPPEIQSIRHINPYDIKTKADRALKTIKRILFLTPTKKLFKFLLICEQLILSGNLLASVNNIVEQNLH